MKIGIFGGSFNPPHIGHINSIQTVYKKLGLEKVIVIPNAQNPLKLLVDGADASQRLEMVTRAVTSFSNDFMVDDREINRGGQSYTIDTIESLIAENSKAEFFLIIGADNFENLTDWKDYKKILEKVNLVVTTRPGYSLPSEFDELPESLKDIVADFDFNYIELKSGKSIQFISLLDVEISSHELRKLLRLKKPVSKYLPLSVENYIKDNNIYRSIGQRVSDYKTFTEFCAQVLFDKKGINVRAYDLTKMSAPTEFALVASGTSTRHASSMAENLTAAVKLEFNLLPQGIEGIDEGRWVVIDYGSLMVHLFYDFVRTEYSIERLWDNAEVISVTDKTLNK